MGDTIELPQQLPDGLKMKRKPKDFVLKKDSIENFDKLDQYLEKECDGNGFIIAAHLRLAITNDLEDEAVDEFIGRCRCRWSAASTSSPARITIKYKDFVRMMMMDKAVRLAEEVRVCDDAIEFRHRGQSGTSQLTASQLTASWHSTAYDKLCAVLPARYVQHVRV